MNRHSSLLPTAEPDGSSSNADPKAAGGPAKQSPNTTARSSWRSIYQPPARSASVRRSAERSMTDRRAQQPERFAQNSGRSARPHASQELYGAAAQPRTASMPLPAVIAAVRGAALGRDERYAGTQVPYAAPQNGNSPEASGHTHVNQVRLLADGPSGDGMLPLDSGHVGDYGEFSPESAQAVRSALWDDDSALNHPKPTIPTAAPRQTDRYDARAAWQKLLGELQLQLPPATYYTWLHDTWVEGYEDGEFIIGTANTYARDWLTTRLRPLVRKTLKEIAGRMVDVSFVVRPRLVEDDLRSAPSPLYSQQAEEELYPDSSGLRASQAGGHLTTATGRRARSSAHDSRLNAAYTFDHFIVGNNNRFACAAAMAIAEKPGHKFNPLFVYGGVGLGKTHLLHAIGNALEQANYAVLYCTSEQFTNDLISSIRLQNTEAFRNKYREIDVLLIDDIQFIAGKESTQEEFFHTFNHLQASGKQVVLSSDRPPRDLQALESRLRSRFEGGIQVDVSAPDFETRVAILQSKAIRLGISVPIEVLKLVAERVESNIRELEGALNHLFLQAQLVQTSLDMALAEHTLNYVSPQRKPCSPPRLTALVAAHFSLTVDELVGPRRTRPIADARHVAMYLLRDELALSLPQIGQLFGGRDHTTVAHAIDKIRTELRNNEQMRADVAQLREQMFVPYQG